MTIQENFSLKNHNTFGVDAKAKYFVEINLVDELKSVLKERKTLHVENPYKLPLLILGGGSNVLFTKDFEGMVVLLNLKGISEQVLEDEAFVTAKAGENWNDFVQFCLQKNYGGLENLSLIPGNVGTSPMQNIGAYGVEIKDHFVHCKALNLETLEVEEFNLDECKFGYRESIFKNVAKGKYAILEVTFWLTTHNHKIKTEYGAIRDELKKMHNVEHLDEKNVTIQEVAKAVISIRESKLPNPKEVGNAGSFFKNPTIPLEQFENLKQNFENIQGYQNGNFVKVPAGWLIESCGWKGKQIGNVACHEKQALVIVNKTGNATGKEIFDFSTAIINSVKEKFGIELEREVNII